jgi:hypothetical protein
MEEMTMLSCKQVARLLSTDELHRASFSTRWGVRMHLWMCRHCSRFAAQIRLLGSAARAKYGPESGKPDTEAESLEDRITRKLSGQK